MGNLAARATEEAPKSNEGLRSWRFGVLTLGSKTGSKVRVEWDDDTNGTRNGTSWAIQREAVRAGRNEKILKVNE
jgi:hypothetical protein